MKSFKDIRSQINEEYYTGPTAYAGGDRTNVGDIAGSDLGGLANGGEKKTICHTRGHGCFGKGIESRNLAGVHQDPVSDLKGRHQIL